MNAKTQAAVTKHGEDLLAIFPKATEQNPVNLCRKLRRLEREGEALGLRLCNGPDFGDNGEQADAIGAGILARVNALLGNVNEYQPKTGAACSVTTARHAREPGARSTSERSATRRRWFRFS